MSCTRQTAVAALTYAAASLCLFGRGVLEDPTRTIVGDQGADKTLYLWSFEWWPYAIEHLRNPLDVSVDWMPHGFDFGLGTAGGGLALAAWPLTTLGGPVITYNVVALLAPALAAVTTFLLARAVSGRFVPSLVGGWVFGFSSYELGHLLGHLPLAFTGLVPLVPLLALRRHRGQTGRRRFVVLLALVLAAQFAVVTQVYFSLVLVGGITALAAWLLWRSRVVPTVVESAVAVALSALLVSPVVLYAAVSHATAPARSPFSESADVLNFVVPTHRTWLHASATDAVAARFTGTGAELGAYLGLPFLVLAAMAVQRTRPRVFLVVVALACAVLALGTRVKVAGTVVGVAPWTALAHLPIVGSALPARLTLYTSLLAGLLVALALADRPSATRYALATLGVLATLPNLQLPTWQSQVPQARFAVPENATTLVLPYGPAGWSMLWQAEARFRYRLVGGVFAVRVVPAERAWRDVYAGLGSGRVTPRRLRAFLTAHRVSRIVVTAGTRPGALRLVRAVCGPARMRGGAAVYEVGPHFGGCAAIGERHAATAWPSAATGPGRIASYSAAESRIVS